MHRRLSCLLLPQSRRAHQLGLPPLLLRLRLRPHWPRKGQAAGPRSTRRRQLRPERRRPPRAKARRCRAAERSGRLSSCGAGPAQRAPWPREIFAPSARTPARAAAEQARAEQPGQGAPSPPRSPAPSTQNSTLLPCPFSWAQRETCKHLTASPFPPLPSPLPHCPPPPR